MTLQEAKSLWVGDIVLLSKSARKGKFLGITAQQKLKVEVNGKIIISSLTNVSVIGTEEVADWRLEIDQELKNPIPTESEKRKKKNIDYSALNSIDLHLEKLLENGTLSTLEHALDVQMKAAKDLSMRISIESVSRRPSFMARVRGY